MYRIAICDDDSRQLDKLSEVIYHYLEKVKIEFILDEYENGEQLIDAFENFNETYQILLLDIEMGATNGIETARILRKKNDDILIIYVTSYDRYTLESFEVSPFRYLMKPVQKNVIEDVLELAIEEINKKRNYLFFKIGNENHQIMTSNIISANSVFGRQIKICLVNGEDFVFYGKIKELESKLDPFSFIKVNSGSIINFTHIDYVTNQDFIKLRNKQLISISRSKKNNFKERYYNFMKKALRI